ncbi:hypothetical protein C2S52_000920 [Perilla frutescens var. hirtella]|nr:hypothetical protein C2S52_000920 [Perilla frutescens var. hirtella]
MSSVSSMWCKIQDLHPSITTSIIKLRLVRMYERPSPANKKDVSLECLFHDFEMYAFKSFGDVQSMENIHEGVLFDVIRLLLTRGEVQTTKCSNGREKKLLKFMLQDTEGKRLSCTLWKDYANEFVRLLEQHGQPSNIIILQFGHANMYKGQVRVCSSYYVTKILVNANVPEVADFRQRIVIASEMCTTIISSTSQETTSSLSDDCMLRTIEQLFFDDQIGRFWIVGKVVDVDLEDGWFYIACKKCYARLDKQEHQFYCKKCNKHDASGNIRYKLTVHVVDETFSAALILWERECHRLIGKRVTDLIQDDKKDSNDLPAEIHNALMEKKFLFKVDIKAAHNSEYKGAYYVCKVTTDLTYINTFNTSHFDSQESNCYSKLESSDHALDKIEDDFPIETPSLKLGEELELVDEGNVKRSLEDAFSSTIPTKKSKAIIKQEKE